MSRPLVAKLADCLRKGSDLDITAPPISQMMKSSSAVRQHESMASVLRRPDGRTEIVAAALARQNIGIDPSGRDIEVRFA